VKKQATVFLVDDNDDLRETIAENLEIDGYNVLVARDARECLEKIKDNPVDIVLLDLGLPDGNGLTLMRDIRKSTDAPILVISGRNLMSDKIIGLDMGADDYIGKPVEMPELSARINAHLRRHKNRNDSALRAQEAERVVVGNWSIDRAKFQIFDKNGQSCNLTVREFRLLDALARAPNRVLSREQLLNATREEGLDIFDRSIDIQITRIRKKIGDHARTSGMIRTVRGAGYMLVTEE
jgi:two-component system, OmpR family, response regulator